MAGQSVTVCCLAGYVIERRLTTEKRWEKVDSVDASVTLYCVENLREKSEYEFRVFAENPVGRSLEPAMTEQVRLKTHASKCARQGCWGGALGGGGGGGGCIQEVVASYPRHSHVQSSSLGHQIS